jgi:nucleotidyltransferase substrate binding protein (TIGR01987 family)
MTDDIRWIQRLNNWTRALAQLTKFMDREELNELEEQGLIQSFKYNHELAWNTQKDFLKNRGVAGMFGSKDVAREAFSAGLISNGDVWVNMIKDRNLSSQTYNEPTRDKILGHIIEDYYEEFCNVHKKLSLLAKQEING